jgi:hypothetical protein
VDQAGDAPVMRLAGLSRAAWGTALLAAPRPVLRTLSTPADASAVITMRVLGARHVLQALATTTRPGPAVRRVGMAVDAVHALTAIILAACDRWRRVPALIETGLAVAWIATALAAPGSEADGAEHGRARRGGRRLARMEVPD